MGVVERLGAQHQTRGRRHDSSRLDLRRKGEAFPPSWRRRPPAGTEALQPIDRMNRIDRRSGAPAEPPPPNPPPRLHRRLELVEQHACTLVVMPHVISYPMVSRWAAHSSALIRSSPWRPMSTTSSPRCTWSSPQSTSNWSIVIAPMMRRRRPADEDVSHVGQVAPHAVGVAERHGRHVRVDAELVAQPVGQPVAGREPLDERHPRLERHDRPQVGGQVVDPGSRRDAVQRDPGPHERPPRRRVGHRPGRVGGVHQPPVGQIAERDVEALELALGVRVGDLVGDGEVGVHPGQVEPRLVGLDALGQQRRRRPASLRPGASRCRS